MEQTADELKTLRACINDLISMLALPAIWSGREPSQICRTLLDALLGMLRLDFAYIQLGESIGGGAPIEMVQVADRRNVPAQPEEVGRALQPWLTADPPPMPLVIPNPVGEGKVSIAVLRLRLQDDIGVLVVASTRAGFATQTERLLLDVAANQAVIGLQEARRLIEQRRIAQELDRLFKELQGKSRQLEAASRHKSEFLANMSHELRTPLTAIIGFSEVLTERMFGELNDKQAEYLQDISSSGQHLLSLINDVLDLSKIEAGRMELELADFDLPSAIENALILLRERASRRRITLEPSIDERVGSIRGDERKVKQVLLNLLSNALKFTPEGGRIDVSARLQDGAAEVAVTDTGVGIAPEDREAVFEEFRQVGTADKKAEGTGLGLALSRKFIELHGGRIWVESEMGKGSTFGFTLPSA